MKMAAKKPKRKATKKKTAPKNPFDTSDKPIVYMTELERKRMDDELGGMLEEPMIQDARDGAGELLVAAAILVLPTGDARLLQWGDEWGDGEGSTLSEHMVVLAGRELRDGESARLDLVHMQMDGAGCTCTVTAGEGFEHDSSVDDLLAPSLARRLDKARREADNVAVLWLAVLTTAAGTRRVVHASMDDGAGESRSLMAQVVRRARRLKWLSAGESIERMRLDLRLSGTSTWTATITADPVSVR